MKTPAELIEDLQAALLPMEDHALAIHQFATLLGVLTAGPDAESAMDGIHRLMLDIRDHAGNLRRRQDEAWQIANDWRIRRGTRPGPTLRELLTLRL